MLATLLPFTAMAIALLRAWVAWNRMPRGVGGLLFQYGVLAAVNGGLLAMEVTDGWALATAGVPVLVVWIVPGFLEGLASTQLRLGRPAPMRWMLTLRALIAWHRHHWLDVCYLPVRLMREFRLAEGLTVAGPVKNGKGPAELTTVSSICGLHPRDFRTRRPFSDLTAIDPDERFNLACTGELSMRSAP